MKHQKRLLSTKMDYWRREVRNSRLERIRNNTITNIMRVKDTLIKTIGQKKLICYGHLRRMEEDKISKVMAEWEPDEEKTQKESDYRIL